MLNVFLGYSCNLSCSYCLQAPLAERERRVKPNTSVFIEKVLPWVVEKNIKEIAYWGGEPLVYWKHIEQIQEAFKEAGHKFDFVKIATNGTLFTDKHVEQCNEWDAYVIVSQHPDFGTPAWDKIINLNNYSLSYLFYHDNLYAWDWIKECEKLEQTYSRPMFPYMHWVRATSGASPDTYLTHEDLDKHIVHLWDLAKLAADGHRLAKNMWLGHMAEWKSKVHGNAEFVPMCFGSHQIDVDLDGNRYACHHHVEPHLKTGTIWEDTSESALHQARKFVDTKECKECPINTWCRGNCHLSMTHDVDCRLSKYKHKILTWLDGKLNDSSTRIFVHH